MHQSATPANTPLSRRLRKQSRGQLCIWTRRRRAPAGWLRCLTSGRIVIFNSADDGNAVAAPLPLRQCVRCPRPLPPPLQCRCRPPRLVQLTPRCCYPQSRESSPRIGPNGQSPQRKRRRRRRPRSKLLLTDQCCRYRSHHRRPTCLESGATIIRALSKKIDSSLTKSSWRYCWCWPASAVWGCFGITIMEGRRAGSAASIWRRMPRRPIPLSRRSRKIRLRNRCQPN